VVSGDLRPRLEERLVALRSELAAGHRLLAELEERQRDVHETMLRITGAIQVLEEALADGARCEEPPPPG
jgi:hypothetical protein